MVMSIKQLIAINWFHSRLLLHQYLTKIQKKPHFEVHGKQALFQVVECIACNDKKIVQKIEQITQLLP